MHYPKWAFFFITVLAVAPSARAATYGLKSHGRAVSSINPSSAYQDLRDDTGWLLTGPAIVSLNADSGTGGAGGAHVDAVLNAISNYSTLHVFGHGDSTNSNQTGAFSWDSSYIGGEPNAWSMDRLHITSSTLPIGAPVTLQFTLVFTGSVSASTPPSGFDTHATLHGQLYASSSTNSPQPNVNLNVGDSTVTSYDTHQTATLQTAVGSYVTLNDKFWIDMSANSNTLSPVFTQSYAFDAATTARIDMLTPGASYVADSQSFSYFPGDTNDDGLVDLTDLNNVLNNFGSTVVGNPGDDDSNGVVDLSDLNNVLNHFGANHTAGTLSAVPEPALACLFAAIPLLTRHRRR